MITLHYLQCSRSFRILWALEELGIDDYQVELYQRTSSYAAPEDLKQIHPLGKAPILVDDGDVIVESAVILDYLQQRYDQQQQFRPQDLKDQRQYYYWMHYAEGSLMPLLVMTLVMNNVSKHVPWIVRPVAEKITDGVKAGFVRPRVKEHILYLEQYLSKHDYFAGEFSFADIQMAFPLIALQKRLHGKYPNIQAFVQRIQQRSAFQKAEQKSLDSECS
ncbi:glutathione S-transferase [Acinetobacter venetianus]|jgi:glutathione S-transferase|uniref:Stringent starvation protein A n=1 Tax=Acinetobacter venetianus TaxID=52133 RepID=A0A137XJG2_9GAMM|nr:glutathione S-transferase [Acinetobacter venetianus]KXO73842.1 glutathione S-transferase [Acinetobacter venetianus]KXZ69832.1 stringent starvation protein A [Acinetobacter venetianus]QNH51117.1 glutathione S-transferase [Acinetobacter venetianus]HIQ35462.1 glutathione S-transferase [Acinetobacter venetianus]HJP47238.1 glutathione S-transferase [Acinetobacter venetianus]